jgi:hypothetical protein
MEGVLAHPGLKIANSVPMAPSLKKSVIDPLPQVGNIKAIAEASGRASKQSEFGIFSPFESEEDSQNATLTLNQRSMSSEVLMAPHARQAGGSTRRKLSLPGLALSHIRQRSSLNLAVQKRTVVISKPLEVITEEEGEAPKYCEQSTRPSSQ